MTAQRTVIPGQLQQLRKSVRENAKEEERVGIRTLVEIGTSPFTTRYKPESKYFGKSSRKSELVAGRSSETLTQTVFPAAIAPA